MQQQFTNFKEFFRSIQILHAAMFMGMFLIMVILKFILGIEDTSNGDRLYAMIGIGLAISCLVIGHLLFSKQIEAIKMDSLPLIDRLNKYQAAYIVKLALLEGPALVCLILHFLNGDPLLFYAFIFMLIMFAFNRPLQAQIKQELRIQPEELT